ncbi:hypothetical protein IEQ34_011533 [Dendrobium chrysotoxum]|uniref:Uncharacterized protein n=1 Tax=Dendrobium chrysotoxum TaxID=161865 RepID=A0AAV7GT51_DENCH|nr:hypothetical protein IEQ34_011533 [Dendrobium chrysotoxum]
MLKLQIGVMYMHRIRITRGRTGWNTVLIVEGDRLKAWRRTRRRSICTRRRVLEVDRGKRRSSRQV